jgi:hypothetical protein
MAAVADPKAVKVNLSTGTGLDIEWKDGHQSHYSFPFLRDACPCALCDEERSKTHQQPGDPPKPEARRQSNFGRRRGQIRNQISFQ